MADPSYSNSSFHYVGPGKQFLVPSEDAGQDPTTMNPEEGEEDYDHEEDGDDEADEDEEEEGSEDDDDDEEEEEELQQEMLVNHSSKSTEEKDDSHNAEAEDGDWRLRDAAYHMIRERKSLQTFSLPKKSESVSLRFSNQWKERIMSIQNHPELYDPEGIVGQAFTAAATAVLQALMLQTTNRPTTPMNVDHQDATALSSTSLLEDSKSFQKPPLIHVLRNACMERAYENKEYTKRRGGKTDAIPSTHIKTVTPKMKTVTTKEASQENKMPRDTSKEKPVESKKQVTSLPPETTSSTIHVKMEESRHSDDEDEEDDHSHDKMSTVSTPDQISSSGNVLIRKCTRNTPASTTSALDGRWQQQRAILRATGDLVFGCYSQEDKRDESMKTVAAAQSLAREISALMRNSFQRSDARRRFHSRNQNHSILESMSLFGEWGARNRQEKTSFSGSPERQPASSSSPSTTTSDSENEETHDSSFISLDHPNPQSLTSFWQENCLPRCLDIMKSKAHLILHDLQWRTRHGRVANILRCASNHGPHLIITTEPDKRKFAREFAPLDPAAPLKNWIMDSDEDEPSSTPSSPMELRALIYQGSKTRRRELRQYFSGLVNGTSSSSPFHVLIVSYHDFLNVASDYLHLCQIPWQAVVVDDGAAWMAAAWDQTSTSLASLWQAAIFARNDHQTGLAGAISRKEWDFELDSDGDGNIPEHIAKEAFIGLTARHRILTASTFALPSSSSRSASTELIHVGAMLEFMAPHFMEVVREEWDRCKITSDLPSMNHFRKLVARSVVVHHPDATDIKLDMNTLALQAMTGKLQPPDRSGEQVLPSIIVDDDFVASGKITFSRRSSLQWLGSLKKSWLRFELGSADFQPILEVMKSSMHNSFICEEITTASSTTTAGANGQVVGSMAYRLAVRCGRHFGSEQGLRQHIAAMHAPPGTWLCRTCSADCVTSQARTHHERVCGVAIVPTADTDGPVGDKVLSNVVGAVGATPIVGQGGKKRGVGKKKVNNPLAAAIKSPVLSVAAAASTDKDPDGSLKVSGYRGVWVNEAGKHFLKIDGKRLTESENSEKLILFDTVDEAAKKYDDILKKTRKDTSKLELNFKADGSRNLYESVISPSQSGLGGSTANVVPALSVINIKDLPPDVKPLLRDPRQTSRTGGNSKRHIYAYRGVCRQARKGHDRWQSQISFMGTNHYLGTFDSEWDAAAIYAWAHLILYGEEATRQAQKEGEEAAAAYEQEQRDIAAGKIPAPVSKADKKKKDPAKKKSKEEKEAEKRAKKEKKEKTKAEAIDGSDGTGQGKKRKYVRKQVASADKKPRTTSRVQMEKEAMGTTLEKAVAKASSLAPRETFEKDCDLDLLSSISEKILEAKDAAYCGQTQSMALSAADVFLRPCIPFQGYDSFPAGIAMLLGLSSQLFGWDLQDFVSRSDLKSEQDAMAALQLLAVEYDEAGTNEKFQTVIQGTICTLGCASKATQQMYKTLGLGTVPLGGTVGKIDCHVGGVPGSCGEFAACIRYAPSETSTFQISCISEEDIVTVNGKRIVPKSGSFPLNDKDICSVGARVFMFVLSGEI